MRMFGLLIFLFLTSLAQADQNDPRLDALFQRLQETTDPGQIRQLETDIWSIWVDSDDQQVDTLMAQGTRAMARRDLDTALSAFDRITDLAPAFAEGWNKRATVYYLQGRLDASMQDIQRTLELEPRHFGALAGMGLIFIKIGDIPSAINAYQEVIKVHPQSPGAQANIDYLREQLHDEII